MAETYTPKVWTNNSGIPISAANLNAIEDGIEAIDDRVAALEASGTGEAIPATIVDAKGDLIAATAADAVARVAAGAEGSVLTSTVASATGVSWTGVAMTSAERTKLTGIASGATANATDAQLRDRSTHTGTQAISTVTGLQTALDAKLTALRSFANHTAGYTLVVGDVGVEQSYNSTSAGTFTIPTNATAAIAVGASIPLAQVGTGQLTIAAASGVTLQARGAAFKLAGQHAQAELVKLATNTWRLYGDITT